MYSRISEKATNNKEKLKTLKHKQKNVFEFIVKSRVVIFLLQNF